MDNPQVRVYSDHTALSRAAAEQFATLAAEAVAAHGACSVALSGGRTPALLYQLLAQPPYRYGVPWAQIRFFWADERAVPPDDEGSNYRQAKLALLDHVPAAAENVFRIKGELDPLVAAEDYAAVLRQLAEDGANWPRIDLVLLGMGGDGHTASLFPGPIAAAEATAPTLVATAQYEDRPAARVSLTPLVFNAARNVHFLVSGVEKARTLAAVLAGPFKPERWPVQRVRPAQGMLRWFVDAAAASLLPENLWG